MVVAEKGDDWQGEIRHQADRVSAAFRNRLRDTIEAMGMDNVVRSTGRSAKTLGRYVDGQTEPPFVVIAMLAEAAGVSITWLATGEGSHDSNSHARHLVVGGEALGGSRMLQLADPDAMEDGAFVLLPRFEVEASAGQGLIPPEEEIRDFVAFAVGHLREAGIDPRQAHVIKVRGRSMMPTLVDGDWVIVDRTKTRVDTGDIYAVVYQEGLRIKRVLKERDAKGREAYVLVSDNTSEGYGDLRIEGPDLADFHVVGRVDRHIRAL